jgi:hypothetical protein
MDSLLEPDRSLQARATRVLIKVHSAQRSSLPPKYLLVSPVTVNETIAPRSGSFGDVRKGIYGKREVAVKTLRIRMEDVDTPAGKLKDALHKVRVRSQLLLLLFLRD